MKIERKPFTFRENLKQFLLMIDKVIEQLLLERGVPAEDVPEIADLWRKRHFKEYAVRLKKYKNLKNIDELDNCDMGL